MSTSCNPNILVLTGGPFVERDASFASAKEVLSALSSCGYRHHSVFEYRTAGWEKVVREADLIYLVVEGPHGEGGVVQGYLEAISKPYVGSPIASCSVTQSKHIFKSFVKGIGYRTPDWIVCNYDSMSSFPNWFEDGVFVKANDQGSSFGVQYATNTREVKTALDSIKELSSSAIIEKKCHGIELTAGVAKLNSAYHVLPLLSVGSQDGFLTCDAKIAGRYWCRDARVDIPDHLLKEIQSCVIEISHRLEVRAFVRFDLVVNLDRELFDIIECNTCPGLVNNHSFIPHMIKLENSNLTFYVERFVEDAIIQSYCSRLSIL